MKKKISIITIIFVAVSALIAILALFGAFKIRNGIADLLFTSLTLSVSGLLILNSVNMLEKKNKLAIVSLSLISISALLVIIALWSNVSSSNVYMETTLTACILSVCFSLITSNILKLQNKYLWLQISSYVCFVIVAIFLISAAWGSNLLGNNVKIFVLFIILSLFGIGVLAVLSKKQINTDASIDKNYIKITKKEYEELLAIKEKYNELKGQ